MWLPLIISAITVNSISCNTFIATISTFGRYEVGKDIICKAVITNSEDRDNYLLKRNTPLDKLVSHTFQITKDGNPVPYDGLLYQRTPPTSKEFLLVPAKSSISTSIELSQSYSLKPNADYKVILRAMIAYYTHNISDIRSQFISSNEQSFIVIGGKTMKLTKAQVVRDNVKAMDSRVFKPGNFMTPSFNGTPKPGDKITTIKVYNATYKNMAESIASVDSNLNLYKDFFGVRKYQYMKIVRKTYSRIKKAMEETNFTFYFDGDICKLHDGVIAYTCKSCRIVYLCDLYRSQPDIKGYDTKLGTLIHELSHAAAYTDDNVYGSRKCMLLAKTYPRKAISNADNYHYFSEPLSQ